MCRLRRTSSEVGKNAIKSCKGDYVDGGGLVSTEVGESDTMESPVVMGCVPVSVVTMTRSGALWRAPPSLAVLRMAAWMRWLAAL